MQQKETLSAYMDGQKVDADFVETLANSPELKQKWASYHVIRSVMQGEEVVLGQDFSAKMEALLENETFEPQESKPKGLLLKLKRWSTPLMQAGIAASVCLVAVLGANLVNNSEDVVQNDPVLQTLPFSNAVESVSYNAPANDLVSSEKLEQQQRRIEALLQNHELQRRTNPNNVIGASAEEKAKSQTSSTAVSEK